METAGEEGRERKAQMIERRGGSGKKRGLLVVPFALVTPRETAAGYNKCHHLEREWWASLEGLEVAEARVCHEVTRQREEEKQTERFHPEVRE